MAMLQPAGFLAQIGSFFFPKTIDAHVRTDTLPNGQVELTPVFVIDGLEVPIESVSAGSQQSILGYSAFLSPSAQQVQKQTQGRKTRLSRKKAGEFLEQLERAGVSLRSKDGKVQPRIATVKPDVTLELGTGDTLAVQSELVTPQGVVLDKPVRLDDLREEDGWYAVGADLLKVELSDSQLDDLLVAEGGNRTLIGDDVPQFLKTLQGHEQQVGTIAKNPPLQGLTVFSGKSENRAKVDGSAESIHILTSLAIQGPRGAVHDQSIADLDELASRNSGFKRVEEGWVDLPKETLDRFRKDCSDLSTRVGGLDEIRGTDIPKTLSELGRIASREGRRTPWSVYFSAAVKDAHRIVESPARVEFRINLVERDGKSLLALDPSYDHERFRLSHDEIEATAQSGEVWVRRRGAWIKVDEDKYQKIAAGIRRLNLQPGKDGFAFPAAQRDQVLEVFSILGTIQHSAAYSQFLGKLADFEKIEDYSLPDGLRSEIELRAYQKHGFNWLAFLHQFGLNGILADDMGLGKTLQTLTAIQRARELSRFGYPSLVICPTSVVANWKAEVSKFLHGCEVIVYTGVRRQRKLEPLLQPSLFEDESSTSPLVITSYDVARLDQELLNQIPWLYVVVDEGHNIKNPDAQRTRAIKTINGQHKLALTGTPIQNNLEELWSLFDFAMPGYLGKRAEFARQYSKGGTVNMEAVQDGKAPLKERINPFILRRLKTSVARDLPPKTIIDRHVELTTLQVELYKQVISSAECQQIVQAVSDNGIDRSHLQILAAFTKLRAICNHPALADRNTPRGPIRASDSGKLRDLKELMEEVVEGEHRALLFSQSTQMLDMIEECFVQWKYEFVRLDGGTAMNHRQLLVDEFNSNPAIHCFLISTKAGGTGLNLTGADTVIFYDHDWNPANDTQAQDRAYRIGQTRPVTVYRLVSQGTIEEKILERQAAKRTLADEIIGSDSEGFKDLTKEDLLSLFTLDEEQD